MLGAGLFTRRIAVDEPIASYPTSGGEEVSFSEAFRCWARIEPLTGREALVANQTLAGMDTRITIRYSERNRQINARWRFRYRDTIYNIAETPRDVEMRHRELEILCKSGLNEG